MNNAATYEIGQTVRVRIANTNDYRIGVINEICAGSYGVDFTDGPGGAWTVADRIESI